MVVNPLQNCPNLLSKYINTFNWPEGRALVQYKQGFIDARPNTKLGEGFHGYLKTQ